MHICRLAFAAVLATLAAPIHAQVPERAMPASHPGETALTSMSGGSTGAALVRQPRFGVSSGPRHAPLMSSLATAVGQPAISGAQGPEPIEYSDWYERRLTIHKTASYALLPLFAFQYVAGRELYENSLDAPEWARRGHGIAATGVATFFAVNTVTGVWNLWDAREDPEGRKWRTTHAVLMLVADAGFTTTGLLAEKAERSPDNRRLHRTIALSSVGVATLSYLMMLPPLRRE